MQRIPPGPEFQALDDAIADFVSEFPPHASNFEKLLEENDRFKECVALVNSKLALVTKEHMGLDGPFLERYVKSDSKYFAFCSDISCDRDFHASLFCVPKGCSLPLHNHPNMLVFGKVLRGKLRVSSFNVKDDISTALKPGTKVAAEFITPSTLCCEGDLMFVSPGVRNVHKVEAVEDAAALARAVTFELQRRGRDDRSERVGYHASVAAMASW